MFGVQIAVLRSGASGAATPLLLCFNLICKANELSHPPEKKKQNSLVLKVMCARLRSECCDSVCAAPGMLCHL